MYQTALRITYMLALAIVLLTLPAASGYAQLQYIPPTAITVEMYQLREGTGENLGILCTKYDTSVAKSFGCTADSTKPYPFDTAVITIGIESHIQNGIQQGYLHNVVPSETNPQSP